MTTYRTDRDKNVKVRCMASMGYHEVTIEAASPAALDVERLEQALVNLGIPAARMTSRAIRDKYARLTQSAEEQGDV